MSSAEISHPDWMVEESEMDPRKMVSCISGWENNDIEMKLAAVTGDYRLSGVITEVSCHLPVDEHMEVRAEIELHNAPDEWPSNEMTLTSKQIDIDEWRYPKLHLKGSKEEFWMMEVDRVLLE